ncbi:MAG: hypothetical protein ACYCW6_17480 [Candidatus Xenobia bacterium]
MDSWKLALGGFIVTVALASGVNTAQAVGGLASNVVYGVGDSSGDEVPGSGVATALNRAEPELIPA